MLVQMVIFQMAHKIMEIPTPRLEKIHEIQLTLKFLLELSLLFVTRNTHMCGF